MRSILKIALMSMIVALAGCAGSGGSAGSAGRNLLPPAALSPAEAAQQAEALSHVQAEQVTITHLPTNVVAVEDSAFALVTPDEQCLLTVSFGEVKQWVLADGSLRHVERFEQQPMAWAKPIYIPYSDYTSGFAKGIKFRYMESLAVPVDNGAAVLVSQHDMANHRLDLQTGKMTAYVNRFDASAGFVALGPGRYANIPSEESSILDVGALYDMELGYLDRYGDKISRQVNPQAELDSHVGKRPMIARAKLVGYDAPRQALYLTRTTMERQWVIEAIDASEDRSGATSRQTVAQLGGNGFGTRGEYSDCKATLSADGRYVAAVMATSENYLVSVVKVAEVATGKVLGEVGPAGMYDPHVTSFANGLLTIIAKTGPRDAEKTQVLTFHVPDLKQVESLQVNVGAETSPDTTIAAVSPSHRYVVVCTRMTGAVASLTVYDLVESKARVLDDDAATRQYAAKAAEEFRAAQASLPAVIAREEAKTKMVTENRIKMEREVRELMQPPVYVHPPEPTFRRSYNSPGAAACSYCGGSGVTVETSTSGGYSDTRQTLHGTEKYYIPKSTSSGTKRCLHCGGSGRVD
ncbi:hypothetical protein BH10PLA1_BH10PLA1_02260 [soil metagenome]